MTKQKSWIDQVFLKVFTSGSSPIISHKGIFQMVLPPGYRYKKLDGIYSVFSVEEAPTFTLQWNGFILEDVPENNFDISKELEMVREKFPDAIKDEVNGFEAVRTLIQYLHPDDELSLTAEWRIGAKNKRILASIVFYTDHNAEDFQEIFNEALKLLNNLTIN